MKDIFISYTKADVELAIKIKEAIEEAGFSVWIDTESIDGGEIWTKKIEAAIKTSTIFTTIISHASSNSDWVTREILYADQHGKTIIPLLADKVTPPLFITERQALKFYEDFDISINKLLKTLHQKDIHSSQKANSYIKHRQHTKHRILFQRKTKPTSIEESEGIETPLSDNERAFWLAVSPPFIAIISGVVLSILSVVASWIAIFIIAFAALYFGYEWTPENTTELFFTMTIIVISATCIGSGYPPCIAIKVTRMFPTRQTRTLILGTMGALLSILTFPVLVFLTTQVLTFSGFLKQSEFVTELHWQWVTLTWLSVVIVGVFIGAIIGRYISFDEHTRRYIEEHGFHKWLRSNHKCPKFI